MDNPLVHPVWLSRGSHDNAAAGLCAMEAVAYLAGEVHTDAPRCVSPVLADLVRGWNDSLEDDDRQKYLAPLLAEFIGTRCDDVRERLTPLLVRQWFLGEYTRAWANLAAPHAHEEAPPPTVRRWQLARVLAMESGGEASYQTLRLTMIGQSSGIRAEAEFVEDLIARAVVFAAPADVERVRDELKVSFVALLRRVAAVCREGEQH